MKVIRTNKQFPAQKSEQRFYSEISDQSFQLFLVSKPLFHLFEVSMRVLIFLLSFPWCDQIG